MGFQFSNSPLDYLPFQKFMIGSLRQIGKVVYQDIAIAVDVLKSVLVKYEAGLVDSTVTWGRKLKVIMCREYYIILFGGVLRGYEVILVESRRLVKIINYGKWDTAAPHVVVPLMGRFK